MGTDIPPTKTVNEDEIPLAQRLLMLQKKRAAELAAQGAKNNTVLTVPFKEDLAPPTKIMNGTKGSKVIKPTLKEDYLAAERERENPGTAPVKIKKDPGAPVKIKGKDGRTEANILSEIKRDPGAAVKAKEKSVKTEAGVLSKIKKDPGLVPKIKPDPGFTPNKRPADAEKVPSNFSKAVKKVKKLEATPSESNQNDDEEENEEFRWWEEQNNDGIVKWTSLEHNGLFFPSSYEPHGVKMHYGGKAINLEPEAEEVATFFAAIVGTDHYENEIFRNNFFEDWCGVLHSINSSYKDLIKEFHKCDFSPITEHLNLLKERKKSMTKEEKIKIKEEKTKIDEFYGWCLLDGRREKVGNFRIEPPGLFRGRGKHPKAGRLKTRVFPEQVTINISKDAKIPSPPPGHSWGKIVNDNTVTWLATWVENINKSQKYVFLAAGSSLKGQSDLKKFETARELNKHVGNIRRVNAEELRSKEMFVRQRATALWLIDRLALRAGNEKGDEEADTVGCCSLRCEHVRLQEPNIVIFDFLGKDSIRYYNEVPVEPIIFKNLGIFMRSPKTSQDPIFDRLNTATLNKYLTGLMPGLTAKVFRTYNASHTFQQELDKTLSEGTIHELVLAYNRANREVAVLCNHQRAVPKSHQQSMEKLTEKILTMKYERHLIRQVLREVASKKELQSECPEALQPEPDLDVETIKRKAAETAAAEREKDANLKEGSPKKRTSNPSKESLLKKFSTLTSRIEAAHNQRIDKDENKTTALGTSKTNYLDPRITIAWCEKHKVPIEKMFNKSLREKFKWAMSVDGDWRF